ncbi:MAG: hypothetical protein BWY86_00709 [Candidatus Aminicenantes bacterium ADurb.Bin508]|nr:MAG: hypothetical protein BWY86_00709 [Candidatus Aminicenantes bacterium ADurb.Bin508]
MDVAEVGHDGHENVGIGVGLLRRSAEFLVEFGEASLDALLLAEGLDLTPPFDHLLDIPVHLSQPPLLKGEVNRTFGTDLTDDFSHEPQSHQDEKGQLPAVIDHHGEDSDDGDRRGDEVGDTLSQHLPHGIDVVGVEAHHFAVGMGVEVTDRKALHILKEVDSDPVKRSRGEGDHGPVEDIGRERTEEVDQNHEGQNPREVSHGGAVVVGGKRRDVVVHHGLEQGSSRDSGQGAEQNRDEDEKDKEPRRPHVPEDSSQSPENVPGSLPRLSLHPRPGHLS